MFDESNEVISLSSIPLMLSITHATSLTYFAKHPTWSRLDAKANNPQRDTRPYVGLYPTTPPYPAGLRMESPVSEPSA